ncbi:MAG TPA: ectoine synthase [Spongiibacteraceae bacterium]|nr:ectoine synthase [Spongiibacteraceae bacterium]
MIVTTLEQTRQSERRVDAENWNSVRMLLKGDAAVGFSFHITTIYAGTETHMHYKNHFEAVYCISGEGEVETVADGKTYPIAPGTLYVLDQHDKHILRARSELQMVCVFNPPLNGKETHDASGAYPLEAEAVAG